jgi:predicted transcriptional regulator of viral defense system
MESTVVYNYLDDYLDQIRAQGRYSFDWKEIKDKFSQTDKALKQSLFRLKAKNRVAQIRNGFYAIITPEYMHQGMLPAHLFIDDMMKSLNRRYYVGLLSAAALHGAAHQQPMEYFVVTGKPALRDIKTEKLKVNFYVKKEWSDEDVIEKKTDAGYINVSSPELTALDLFYYLESITVNLSFNVIQELAAELKVQHLVKVARRYPQTVAIQRLGYILDKELHDERFVEPLLKVLKERKFYPVSLSLGKDTDGELDSQWKVIKNTTLESDL